MPESGGLGDLLELAADLPAVEGGAVFDAVFTSEASASCAPRCGHPWDRGQQISLLNEREAGLMIRVSSRAIMSVR